MPFRKSLYKCLRINNNIETIIIVTLHLGSVISQNSQRCGDEGRGASAHVSESASFQCACSLTTSLICFGSQMLLPWATGKWYFS